MLVSITEAEDIAQKVWLRGLTSFGRLKVPDGQMPQDMRLMAFKQRPQLRAAIEELIAWEPERVVPAHGRWYD
jgi:hypothetical protein